MRRHRGWCAHGRRISIEEIAASQMLRPELMPVDPAVAAPLPAPPRETNEELSLIITSATPVVVKKIEPFATAESSGRTDVALSPSAVRSPALSFTPAPLPPTTPPSRNSPLAQSQARHFKQYLSLQS